MSTVETRVFDVDEAAFERDVLERSRSVPVVVDFWAAWCGPCRTLGPLLEKLATEADGAWVLAKVDVDRNQMLASAFGVQGIPAVKGFKDGRLVAEFTGALPEAHVREWLTQLGPTKAELLIADAQAAEGRDDAAEALRLYRAALAEEPANPVASHAVARLELAQGDGSGPFAEVDSLVAGGRAEQAFARMLETIASTTGDEREQARVHLLKLFEAVGPADPRVTEARRSLSRLLF